MILKPMLTFFKLMSVIQTDVMTVLATTIHKIPQSVWSSHFRKFYHCLTNRKWFPSATFQSPKSRFGIIYESGLIRAAAVAKCLNK